MKVYIVEIIFEEKERDEYGEEYTIRFEHRGIDSVFANKELADKRVEELKNKYVQSHIIEEKVLETFVSEEERKEEEEQKEKEFQNFISKLEESIRK